MTASSPHPPRKLVYGHAKLHDCLAFADGETAGEEAREILALAAATTWGEAERIEMRHTWNPVSDVEDEDAPFVVSDVAAVVEGDWPPMVTSRAFDLLPADLRRQFGKAEATALNGDFLEIPVAAENDLVAALRERGFEVTRDDDLINTLDGQPLQG